MMRRSMKINIHKDGTLEVLDPDLECIPLLTAIDPAFQLQRSPLPEFTTPRFQKARQLGCNLSFKQLAQRSEQELWEAHNRAQKGTKNGGMPSIRQDDESSVLDLTMELARRVLSKCRFCENRCNVNRTQGESGRCGLGPEGWVAEHFLHVAEEGMVNPSVLLNLLGCGLRCRSCNKATLLDPTFSDVERLEPTLWDSLDMPGARSLSFAGGSPDESTYSILKFLNAAPARFNLPVVWNCHAYQSQETLQILDGVVDAFLVDFKYGNENCGRRLSLVSGYPAAAKRALENMILQAVPVIVRIPVLPGHFACCHAPSLEFLSTLEKKRLFISVRGQYSPNCMVGVHDANLARRPTLDEIEAVRREAIHLGLELIV